MSDLLRRLEASLDGRYAIERELGRGGSAAVYLARDIRHHRLVALKVLRPDIAAALGPERFLREIEIAAGLTHPHIVPIHDSGNADGLLYFVMPYVPGDTLRQRLRREAQLPIDDAVRLTRDIASALGYAHAQGFVHRDIKPENILLEHGEAVVADFGLARALEAAAPGCITESGFAVGTPAYMSPEQAQAADVDARADLYSLGCVLYEMLSGETPFTGHTPQVVLARHRSETPRPLRTIRPSVPPELEQVVMCALQKLPADRYSSAAALIAALPEASSPRTRVRSQPRRMRYAARALAVAAVVVAAVVVAAFAAWRVRSASAPERSTVLMADFEGPGDDPSLVEALQGLISAELNQSSVVATMPRAAVRLALRAAGLPETTHVTMDIGRDLAIRNSVRTVLGGSIRPLGPGRYSIVLDVVDADSGAAVVTAIALADDSNLVREAQAVARQVRQGLGERRSAIERNRPLWLVTTPSLAAYRKYSAAIQLSTASQLANSNELLHEAIALDTGFAAAWGAMGMNFISMRNLDSARFALGEALRRPERLGDAERYRFSGDAAYALDGDLASAVRWYGLYIGQPGHSLGGRNNRGLFLSALGRYEEALADFQGAVAEDHFGGEMSQIPLLNAAATLVVLGRIPEARLTARRLTGPGATYASVLITSVSGRWAEAESLAAGSVADPAAPPWLRMQAVSITASALAFRSGAPAADRTLRAAAEANAGSESRWYEHARLLLALAADTVPPPLSGRVAADTMPGGVLLRGLWAAARGDTVTASAYRDSLSGRSTVERRRLGAGPAFLTALLALRLGRPAETIRLIAPAAADGENDATNLDRISTIALRLLTANAYAALGRSDSAAVLGSLATGSLRMPPGMLALRGIPCAIARPRVTVWRRRAGMPPLADAGCGV
jgi:tetratricopeptide (TPR) repeat protein